MFLLTRGSITAPTPGTRSPTDLATPRNSTLGPWTCPTLVSAPRGYVHRALTPCIWRSLYVLSTLSMSLMLTFCRMAALRPHEKAQAGPLTRPATRLLARPNDKAGRDPRGARALRRASPENASQSRLGKWRWPSCRDRTAQRGDSGGAVRHEVVPAGEPTLPIAFIRHSNSDRIPVGSSSAREAI